MHRKFFTEEEPVELKRNPYVSNVTPSHIFFTKRFKEIFYSPYKDGKHSSAQILNKLGINTEILGEARVRNIPTSVCKEYAKHHRFYDGNKIPRKKTRKKPVSEKEQLKQLQSRLEYLEEQFEFLKKIGSSRFFVG